MKLILDGREIKEGDMIYALDIDQYVQVITIRNCIKVRTLNCNLSYYIDGKAHINGSRMLYAEKPEIIPPKPPRKISGYINIYDHTKLSPIIRNNKTIADDSADTNRTECIRVEFYEGQFDD